jgi:Cu/Ag efflux protein CusF
MKKVLIILVAIWAIVAFVSGGVLAQEKKAEGQAAQTAEKKTPEPKAMKAEGTVVAYDSAAKALKIKAKNQDMDFTVADGAKIKGEVKEGAKVKVSYKKEGDKMVVTAISVAAGKKHKS